LLVSYFIHCIHPVHAAIWRVFTFYNFHGWKTNARRKDNTIKVSLLLALLIYR
jgi:hypothetical protein